MASGGKIQTYSKRIIEHCCRELLVQNYDPDACEHPDAGDQIREVLIRRNYVAQKDIETCCCLDVSGWLVRLRLQTSAHHAMFSSRRVKG